MSSCVRRQLDRLCGDRRRNRLSGDSFTAALNGGSNLSPVDQPINGRSWLTLGSHWFLIGVACNTLFENLGTGDIVAIAGADW